VATTGDEAGPTTRSDEATNKRAGRIKTRRECLKAASFSGRKAGGIDI